MIISRFEGGLGNVMFQYALARKLSMLHNTSLTFDVTSYKTNPLGDYSFCLEKFGISIADRMATPEDIAQFERKRRRRGKLWFLHNALFSNPKRYVEEQFYFFTPEIIPDTLPFYLRGWWQSEKYFADVRDTLLEDFTLQTPFSEHNAQYAAHIATTNSISIHVRRLDYVTNPLTRKSHGELSPTYYEHAIKHIAEQVENPTLFVFSDDIAWVAASIPLPYPTVYVGGNLESPHEDMLLMSLAKHNIVANSSFSWWGAWLNQNKEKIVVAPNHWVRKKPVDETRDVVPRSWHTIPPYWNNE